MSPALEPAPLRRAPGGADPIYLWNPVGFDPIDWLPQKLYRHGDCARFVLHRIHYATVFDRRLQGEFVPLKAAYLRRFFPGDHVYTRVREALLSGGAIVCDNYYIAGEKSFGYKLGPELSPMRQHRIAVTNRTLWKKLRDRREQWVKTPLDVHRRLFACLRGVGIDYPAALDWLLGEGVYDPSDETAIQLIRDGEFFFHVCPYNRVHTNLTNLRSDLRGFLTYEGGPLVNLDIRNSQPLMFALILREHYGPAAPADVRRYVDLVQAGRFYDQLMDEAGIDAAARPAYKQRFFGHVFFCRNWPETDAARAFGAQFPNVYRLIREAKADDYTALAKRLQRAESGVMIERVAARCLAEMPRTFIGTIHDSVVTTPDRAAAVRSVILEEFGRFGLTPTIQVEELRPPDAQHHGRKVAS
jgi:hypothetical protein